MSINLSVTSTGLPSYTLCILFKSCLFWIRFQSVLWILCYPPWLFTLLHITFGLFPFVSALLLLPIVPPSAFCCLSWIQFKSVLCVFFWLPTVTPHCCISHLVPFPYVSRRFCLPDHGSTRPPLWNFRPPLSQTKGGALDPPFRIFFKKYKRNLSQFEKIKIFSNI